MHHTILDDPPPLKLLGGMIYTLTFFELWRVETLTLGLPNSIFKTSLNQDLAKQYSQF